MLSVVWVICNTVDIRGPTEMPSCRSLSSLVVQCVMFLLPNSGSVVRICVDSVVSSIAHTSMVKMDADRTSAACQVVMLVFWVEKLEFYQYVFNDAVSCYKEMYWNRIKVSFIFHMLFERLVLVTHLLLGVFAFLVTTLLSISSTV